MDWALAGRFDGRADLSDSSTRRSVRYDSAVSTGRRVGPLRLAAFAAAVTLAFFVGLNALVEEAEDVGLVDTLSALPPVQIVAEGLFELRDGSWETTDYAEQSLVPSRFAAEKGDRWRMFVVGGSWAMGSPYQVQGGADQKWPGGVPGFLRASLEAESSRPTEVINTAAGGQDSHRVAAIAEAVLRKEPDALLVATCNNEGAPAPNSVQRFLAKQGAARLLSKLRAPADPSLHTAQDEDTAMVRRAFEANLERIAASSAEHGVRLYLATLPLNLEYRGFEPGHLGPGLGPNDVDFTSLREGLAAEVRPLHDPQTFKGAEPCTHGLRHAAASDLEAALPLLQRCIQDPSDEPVLSRLAAPALAGAWMEEGARLELAEAELAKYVGACVASGVGLLHRSDAGGAIERLRQCSDDVPEALRWIGFAEAAAGNAVAAEAAWRQSIEYLPRNRCRPSFNDVVRRVAARHEHAVLIDLDAAYRALPPPAPGRPLFHDYCHMDWAGYSAMGRPIFDAIQAHEDGLLPRDARPLSDAAFQERYDLPEGSLREQLARFARAGR
jgi:hypothetical protein